MTIKNALNGIFLTAILALIISCGSEGNNANSSEQVDSKRAGINEIIVHISSDPDRLNVITATSADASEVQKFIFESLTDLNMQTLKRYPYLSKENGVLEEVTFDFDGKQNEGLSYSYEIREEAKWNDGTPITGHDAAFYVKCIKNPKVDCESLRPYYDAIVDVIVNEENPKKLTILFKDKYFLAESLAGLALIQKSYYDPEGLMDKITVRELSAEGAAAKYSENININKFATLFNSEEYSRDKISGSGPYNFVSWSTGERIILEKNQNWWGKNLVGNVEGFDNAPDKITFEIIVDPTTALTAQKDEGLDIMKHSSKDYVKLKDDNNFLTKFSFQTPISPSYSYIGLNTKSPKLSDKRVRIALSMAFDYETFKEVYLYGLADRTVSPIHPLKDYYNNNITPYPFDLEKASALLEEAGWIDEDGDGIRQKELEGEDVDLSLEFKYTSGSAVAENMALLYKRTLAQIGVGLEITQKEWTVFLEDTKSHNFEIVTLGWSMGPELSDLKQIWHTDSYNGGSNYVGFGNAESDAIIDAIRFENDVEKRNALYLQIQEIIHDEAPYIFLFTGKSKIAFHNRFENGKAYNMRPGYRASEIKTNMSWGAKASIQ